MFQIWFCRIFLRKSYVILSYINLKILSHNCSTIPYKQNYTQITCIVHICTVSAVCFVTLICTNEKKQIEFIGIRKIVFHVRYFIILDKDHFPSNCHCIMVKILNQWHVFLLQFLCDEGYFGSLGLCWIWGSRILHWPLLILTWSSKSMWPYQWMEQTKSMTHAYLQNIGGGGVLKRKKIIVT